MPDDAQDQQVIMVPPEEKKPAPEEVSAPQVQMGPPDRSMIAPIQASLKTEQERPQIPILAPQPATRQHFAEPHPQDARTAIMVNTAHIHNPIMRTLARMGGMAGNALLESTPGIAEQEARAQQADSKLMQAQHQNEIVDLKAQHTAELEKLRETARTALEGQKQTGASNLQGEKAENAQTIEGMKEKAKPQPAVADLERQAMIAHNSGDMETYKNTLDQISDLKKAEKSGATTGQRAVTLKLPDGSQKAGYTEHGQLMLENGQHAPEGSLLYSAPTYASTKTVDVFDGQGNPTKMQFNPETLKYDKPVGISTSGAAGGRIAQASVVQRAGDQVIKDITENKEALGDLAAWVEKYGLNTPVADEKLAGLRAELISFAALQPALHGFRAASAQEAFEHLIGDIQKDPDATIASIKAIQKTAGAFLPLPVAKTAPTNNTPAHGGSSFAQWKAAHK